MRNTLDHPHSTDAAFRWSARILSIFSFAVLLLFVIGERPNLLHFTDRELLMFLFFPLGLYLGMALAWHWELAGGALTLACLAAFYLVNWVFSSHFPRGWALLVFALPGFLFFICGLVKHSRTNPVAA